MTKALQTFKKVPIKCLRVSNTFQRAIQTMKTKQGYLTRRSLPDGSFIFVFIGITGGAAPTPNYNYFTVGEHKIYIHNTHFKNYIDKLSPNMALDVTSTVFSYKFKKILNIVELEVYDSV